MLSSYSTAVNKGLHASVDCGNLLDMLKEGKPHETTILYLRGTSREVARKLKAAAALQGQSLTAYIQDLLETHVQELEKKGLLPKGKG